MEDDDSGSEFEAKSGSEYASSGDNSEDEALMLSAAVEVSLQAARIAPGTASSSKTRLPTANPAAVAKAAAVERRLTRGRKMAVDEDDGYPGSEMDVDIPSSDSESEEEPIPTKKGKGKGKAKPKGKAPAKANAGQIMTLAQLRAQRREELKLIRAERRANKAEERALVRQLGRSLTYVGFFFLQLEKKIPPTAHRTRCKLVGEKNGGKTPQRATISSQHDEPQPRPTPHCVDGYKRTSRALHRP